MKYIIMKFVESWMLLSLDKHISSYLPIHYTRNNVIPVDHGMPAHWNGKPTCESQQAKNPISGDWKVQATGVTALSMIIDRFLPHAWTIAAF